MSISLQELKKQGKINIVTSNEVVKPTYKSKPIGNKVLDVAKNVGGAIGELNKGLAKSVGSTLYEIGNLGYQGLKKLNVPGTSAAVQKEPQILEQQGLAQKVGGFAGEMAQFLTPVGA